MHGGMTSAGEWESWMVVCRQCDTLVKTSSLHSYLANQHNSYPAVVVPADYLEPRVGVRYQVHPKRNGKLPCPVLECPGELKDGWMLRPHFWDLCPSNRVVVPLEGPFPWCKRCWMQVNPAYPRHIRTKLCRAGMDRQLQQESAVSLALTLWRKFTINGLALELVEVFKYLGCLLAQDDNDVQAIRQQMQKARGVWAHVGQVLRGETVMPWVAAKLYFYKAVVQAILLYGSKMWNLMGSALARLEGFHICVEYRMAWEH